MAVIFPAELPESITSDPMRGAEVEVYHALRSQLPVEYRVYYSSPWLGTDPDGREIDGEADFIVAHPDKGLLFIEVKGGVVRVDSNNRWTSTNRDKITWKIKNPVQQAKQSKYELLKKLNQSKKWNARFINAHHGVILPHVSELQGTLRADMSADLFAFDKDLPYLAQWVEIRLQSGADSADSLGADGMEALNTLVAGEIQFQVRSSTLIAQDLRTLALKTNEQILYFRDMAYFPRLALPGAAGTGKTILAIEKSILLAQESKRTLLLCYNRPLSLQIASSVADYPLVTAANFDQFCRQTAAAAGQQVIGASFAELAARLVENFSVAHQAAFDAIIIDEGQDFEKEWLIALEQLVKGGADGVLYVFYDNNQNVKSTSLTYLEQLPAPSIRLSRNFRNTRAIFQQADRYYKGHPVRPLGPPGEAVAWHECSQAKDLKSTLLNRVASLIQQDGVPPSNIAILFPDRDSIESLLGSKNSQIGRHPVIDAERRSAGALTVDTIRRFKGLEKPVVLLVLPHSIKDRTELIYTALTRPKVLLEVFGPSWVLQQIKEPNV
jgi:hypothetical protein